MVISNNGTNFVGAAKEKKAIQAKIDNATIKSDLAQTKIV